MFSGSYVALVTPFAGQDAERVNEAALRRLVDWQIEAGTDGLVPCGTTGESPTLSVEEHKRVIAIVVEQAAGRVPVLAGTGGNATSEAIELTRYARKAGAAGSLQVTPYYNKPTPEGYFRHIQAIARAVDLPIVLYNVPGRTVTNVQPETVARCAKELDRVVGIKEASGDLEQVRRVLELCGPEFDVLSGEDAQNVEILGLGGRGWISVTANVVPERLAACYDAWAAGDKAKARALQKALQPLHAALFFETNPIPVKTALGLIGKCSAKLRLPLCEMGLENRRRLEAALKGFHLL